MNLFCIYTKTTLFGIILIILSVYVRSAPLQNLNVDNITEVEDLYLMVAQLTLAATYVAAQTKAARKNISFEDALDGIGGEDSVSVLEETFASQPEIEHFFKFITIDEQYRPTKEAWAGLHAKMAFIARKVARRENILNHLNVTVPAYLAQGKSIKV